MNPLDDKIAYITINPSGKFLKSAQLGFAQQGIYPKYLIHLSPKNRLRKELKWYKMGMISRFLIPKIKQHLGNKKSFSEEKVDIKIPEIHRSSALNSDQTKALIQELGIKYLINCGAGIFRSKIIDIEGLQILNAHAGKLPDFKNMNVVEWAIIMEKPVTGTVHLIDRGIDTGKILHQEQLDISTARDLTSAREQAFDQVIRLVGKTVVGLETAALDQWNTINLMVKTGIKCIPIFKKIVDKKLSQRPLSVIGK